MMPVRCFTCNKVIANKEEKYKSMLKQGLKKKEVLDLLNMNRYCCRRMFLGHVDITDQLLHYSNDINNKNNNKSKK